VARADALVDAMFGTGFRGSLSEAAAAVAAASQIVPTVAVDIPSGVDGAPGVVRGAAEHAGRTVTFAASKPGLWFEPGRAHVGALTVADIGIALTTDGGAPAVGVTEASDVGRWLPARAADTHKWAVGGVMVVGGTAGMTGAPLLVSHAAMRAGAGIVWCLVPGAAAAAAASGTEVITRALPVGRDGALDAEAVTTVTRDADRFGAVVLGPGLGGADATAEVVLRLLPELAVPLVLDADGLNALRGDLDPVRARSRAGRVTVLTPHDGEYARLAGHAPTADRVAAARDLAATTGAVVLLKGPTTVVAEPGAGGRVALNPTGSPALATAGSGDVLSGIIGAFCARGVRAFEAAAAAAFVHGRAADVAGHTGLVAGDLVGALRRALGELAVP
jgi:NAD(P)H-hydrate epimerase